MKQLRWPSKYELSSVGMGIGAGLVAFTTTNGDWFASIVSGFFATMVLLFAPKVK